MISFIFPSLYDLWQWHHIDKLVHIAAYYTPFDEQDSPLPNIFGVTYSLIVRFELKKRTTKKSSILFDKRMLTITDTTLNQKMKSSFSISQSDPEDVIKASRELCGRIADKAVKLKLKIHWGKHLWLANLFLGQIWEDFGKLYRSLPKQIEAVYAIKLPASKHHFFKALKESFPVQGSKGIFGRKDAQDNNS